MTDEQAARAWFVKLLADFRIYSPLYKVTVLKHERDAGVYMVKGEVNGNSINVSSVYVDEKGAVVNTSPVMIYKGAE